MKYESDELYHHGIKGMKWGVRRYQRADGTLTPAGIKRYAEKGYAEDEYNSNRTVVGKVYDKLTGANKISAQFRYADSSKAQNKARAEKYLSDQKAKKESKEQTKVAKKTAKEQQNQYGSLEDAMTYGKKVKEKDLISAQGSLEDAISYSKYGNKRANDFAKKAIQEIDRQLSQTGKKPTYDAKKVNSYIESALSEIDKELRKNRS